MRSLVLAIVLLLINLSYTHSQNFFINDSFDNLVNLNISNGCTTTNILNIGGYTDIASHPDGFLYAVKSNGQLYRIDTSNGLSTYITAFQGSSFYALTADSEGRIFAASGNGELASYQPSTSNMINYPNMGYNASGDLTFYQGEMYMASTQNTLVKIIPNNPSANEVFIDFSSANAVIYGIVSYVDGCNVQTYALSNDLPCKIFEIDWINASFNYVCSIQRSVYGGASQFEFNASVDAISILDTLIQVDGCQDQNADLIVQAESINGDIDYSLDGNNYIEDGIFEDLNFGNYTLYLIDESNCEKVIQISVQAPSLNVDITSTNATCGISNGSILINPIGNGNNFQYSIDNGNTLSTSNYYENLSPQDYYIYVIDDNGCEYTESISIENQASFEINDIIVRNTSCDEVNGSIFIDINTNNNQIEYSLNGNSFQSENYFTNLEAGEYYLIIQDQNNCSYEKNINILSSEAIEFISSSVIPPDCGKNNGQVIIEGFAGENIDIFYQLGNRTTRNGVFNNVAAGTYPAYFFTSDSCFYYIEDITIIEECEIYIPNAFSPNNDRFNDIFQIYAAVPIEIKDMSIFDRWGNLVFLRNNFYSNNFNEGWDGKIKGEYASPNVYIYHIVVVLNGVETHFYGDVTLLR